MVQWENLFGSEVSIKDVSNEEKSEFSRYLVELELERGRPKRLSSIISDQNLRAFFDEITFPVHDVKDFDKLPIPFRAVTVDIVNGKEVVLELGSKSGNVGFILEPMPKHDLFRTIILDGALPRKTFSMGEADEKRFYLECRKITD